RNSALLSSFSIGKPPLDCCFRPPGGRAKGQPESPSDVWRGASADRVCASRVVLATKTSGSSARRNRADPDAQSRCAGQDQKGRISELKQTQRLEARMLAAADHQMIVDLDFQSFCRRGDFVRHCDV